MSGPSLALASLTATYTDSEAEEDGLDGENDKSPNDDSSINSNNSNAATPPVNKLTTRVAQLVSYHDDTLVSDEEGVTGDALDSERRKSTSADAELEPADGVKLFPEPTGRCSNELQEKINRLYEKMESSGLDMNHVIQQRKDFRNPSIYEKLIQFCSINELGTNYPAQAYDPLRWGKESFYEELAKVQKAEMDRHEKERKDKTKVEFVSGTAKRPGSGSGAEDDAKRRKSKWDQVGTMVANNMTQEVDITRVDSDDSYTVSASVSHSMNEPYVVEDTGYNSTTFLESQVVDSSQSATNRIPIIDVLSGTEIAAPSSLEIAMTNKSPSLETVTSPQPRTISVLRPSKSWLKSRRKRRKGISNIGITEYEKELLKLNEQKINIQIECIKNAHDEQMEQEKILFEIKMKKEKIKYEILTLEKKFWENRIKNLSNFV